jgi:mannose-6-phosphate isomerase
MDLTPAGPPLPLPGEGPRIVLGISGDVFVAEAMDGTPVEVTPGTAAYVPAETGPATVAGVGEVFVASVAS